MNKWCITILAILAGCLYFCLNPTESHLFPKCPFYALTGLKCPGCGSQRALHALLHLDFVAAFRYNALLISSLPILSILGYAELTRDKHPEQYAQIHHTRWIGIYFILTIMWWVGRNIFQV